MKTQEKNISGLSELKIKVRGAQRKHGTQPRSWMHFILIQLIHQALGGVMRDWRGEAAAKLCVPRVRWQMALASVVVIMAAVLRAFVWPWGKLNGSVCVSHTAKWWHSQISNPDRKDVQIEDLVSDHTTWKSWCFCKTTPDKHLTVKLTKILIYCRAMFLYEPAN